MTLRGKGVLDGWGLKIRTGFKELRKWRRERGVVVVR